MSKRTDDRDAKKSLDEATDDPREANKDGTDQQAAELQTDERGERDNPRRFAPDSTAERHDADTRPSDATVNRSSKDEVKEP
jgi:hypothetical protein